MKHGDVSALREPCNPVILYITAGLMLKDRSWMSRAWREILKLVSNPSTTLSNNFFPCLLRQWLMWFVQKNKSVTTGGCLGKITSRTLRPVGTHCIVKPQMWIGMWFWSSWKRYILSARAILQKTLALCEEGNSCYSYPYVLSHWICTRSICKRGDERPFWVPILYMASRIGISIHLFLLVLHYEAKEQIFQEHETQPKKQVEWSEPAWRSWFQRCLSDTSFVCFSIRLCMYIVQYMKWSFKRTHG